MWAAKAGKQLGNPTRSVAGWLITKFFKVHNQVLEEYAVQLCKIRPGDTVLEMGHGAGLGLQLAAKLLTQPTGQLIGVDYSEYMHQMASDRMKKLVASGKVTLHHCDLTAMPLGDSTVDKVFHCNCYYYWPDIRKGAAEIHRVMKAVMWAAKAGKQLGNPTQSVAGWLITKFLKMHNRVFEEYAVQLCNIRPGDTVLEVGHGPGLGLQLAAKLLTQPTGQLIGVDYSEYMHQMASDRMKKLVASGKVTLHHCDLTAMPLGDSTVDKVFHCNCYYYWPDLRKGAAEIHRVMKAGGLMVTTLRLSRVVLATRMGVIQGLNWRPEDYMAALRGTGFTDVRMEDKWHKHICFQVIYATASK